MSVFKNVIIDASKEAGVLKGNQKVTSVQNATNVTVEGMDLFREKVNSPSIQKGHFDFQKGNLFEYIEAAKFNRDAALKGSNVKAIVTEAIGRPTDATDIEIIKNASVVRQVQAKFSDAENAAAASVNMQKKKKYTGMQRLIRKEENYVDKETGKKTSLLAKSKDLAKEKSKVEGSVYQQQYKDVYENLTDELHYENVTSGGTTLNEVKEAYYSPEKYAKKMEYKQVMLEAKCSATNMAKASMVTTGVSSGITNLFQVFKNEKTLSDAIKNVRTDALISGLRGGTTGAVGATLRYNGLKSGNKLLSDSTASTIMASGIVDGGVALYSYALGEISAEELGEQLVETTAKAATTVYFTKAVETIGKNTKNSILPFAIYTTSSYVFAATRDIIRSAKLNEEQYDKMTAILLETTKQIEDNNKKLKMYLNHCTLEQKQMMEQFINTFEYNIQTGENYDNAIQTIVRFAEQTAITLQYVKFEDFSKAMKEKKTFILE